MKSEEVENSTPEGGLPRWAKVLLFILGVLIVLPEIIPIGIIWWVCRCLRKFWLKYKAEPVAD